MARPEQSSHSGERPCTKIVRSDQIEGALAGRVVDKRAGIHRRVVICLWLATAGKQPGNAMGYGRNSDAVSNSHALMRHVSTMDKPGIMLVVPAEPLGVVCYEVAVSHILASVLAGLECVPTTPDSHS